MAQPSHDTLPPSDWTPADSLALYNIEGWGNGYFTVDSDGHLLVRPKGPAGGAIDLETMVRELQDRGIGLPLLVRFSELVESRLEEIHEAFRAAIDDAGYAGRFQGVYPIKVNQDRHLVERLVSYGQRHHFGLEAGSKPELLAVIALVEDPEALIVCNGYKDEEYIEIALLASKLGRRTVLVVEKPAELPLIAKVAERTGLRPRLGLRSRLSSRGSGHWQESGGERSKFGLSGRELVAATEFLAEHDMLDACQLLHFHRQPAGRDPGREGRHPGGRLGLRQPLPAGSGAALPDVGGGLGIDYDGTQTERASSTNYTLQEYANDVVWGVQEICRPAGVAMPTLVTESGRATVAHHAALILDVLGTAAVPEELEPSEPPPTARRPCACSGTPTWGPTRGTRSRSTTTPWPTAISRSTSSGSAS
ncbi:MAG: biosynthetic arginine decarboxylase [Thermoanaerobaculia bacterium]